jgi:hypothetical protein
MSRHQEGLTPAELGAALIKGCTHHGLDWGEEAAVHLLIAQGTWLRRAEFAGHVTVEELTDGSLSAWADWTEVTTEPDTSPASSGELAVLRLACHLAGHLPETTDNTWSISDIVMPLDATNGLLASRAVAMAAIGPTTVGPLR